MTQPLSVTTDLERLREQREYEASEGEEERKGRLWFRNCETGCPANESYKAKVIDAVALGNACKECQLSPGPCAGARVVSLLWPLPDAVLRLNERPYWQVSALSYLRAVNRSGGF